MTLISIAPIVADKDGEPLVALTEAAATKTSLTMRPFLITLIGSDVKSAPSGSSLELTPSRRRRHEKHPLDRPAMPTIKPIVQIHEVLLTSIAE